LGLAENLVGGGERRWMRGRGNGRSGQNEFWRRLPGGWGEGGKDCGVNPNAGGGRGVF